MSKECLHIWKTTKDPTRPYICTECNVVGVPTIMAVREELDGERFQCYWCGTDYRFNFRRCHESRGFIDKITSITEVSREPFPTRPGEVQKMLRRLDIELPGTEARLLEQRVLVERDLVTAIMRVWGKLRPDEPHYVKLARAIQALGG